MKTLLEDVESVDQIIRDLHKLDSKLQAGQFIAAYRDVNRMIAFFEQVKKNIILGQNDTSQKSQLSQSSYSFKTNKEQEQ